MKDRLYSIEGNVLTIHDSCDAMPFNVWRDVGRLAGVSYDLPDKVIFEFLLPEKIPEAERVLQGAMWQKKG